LQFYDVPVILIFPISNLISESASNTTQIAAHDLIHNKTLSYLKKEKRKQL